MASGTKQIKHITVLGGGLTGLTSAYRLAQLVKSSRQSGNPSLALHPEASITLLERSARVGGWVHSRRRWMELPEGVKDDLGVHGKVDVVLESGPRSIRPRGSKGAAQMLKLLQDLDLTKAILPVPLDHPSAKNRFILDLRNHKLVKLPSSVIDALTLWLRRDGRGSGILKGFLRSILLEPFRRKKRLDAKVPSTSKLAVLETQINDTSVDNLVRRTLGPRIADSLISSMVHGIYAADSRVLSVRSTFPVLWDALQARGSLVLGLLRPARSVRREDAARAEKEAWESLGGDMDAQRKTWSIYGIRGGVETLTKKLEEEIHKLGVDVRVGQTIEKLEPTDDGCRVSLSSGATLDTTMVVSTLSPAVLADLLPSQHSLPNLSYNPATSVGVVNLVFPIPPERIHPPGFGYLVPRTADSSIFAQSEALQRNPNPDGIIGVIFDSTSMTGVEDSPLIASHFTKLTVMMGGPHWSTYPSDPFSSASPAIPIPQSSELAAKAMAHLRKVFPSVPEPVLTESHISKNCIPTYLVGHGQRLHQLHKHLGSSAWRSKLVLLGSGYGGVGVNDCVGMAEQAVENLNIAWSEAPSSTSSCITGLERWKEWD